MRKSFAASVFAASLLALCTGAALAGNGHGNGGGDTAQAAEQHGNPHGDGSGTVQSGGSNDHGAKPSSDTQQNTYARADSDKTKRYGNGNTAGRIATSRGAKGDTVLHGPGNSQPHKVLACGHKHEVDVHAVKSYDEARCGAQQHVAAAHVEKQHVERRHAEKAHVEEKQQAVVVAQAPAEQKVYVCHATGSATNPYVLIHVSKHAEQAHMRHQGGRDVVLGESVGAGCPAPPAAVASAQAQQQEQQTCTTTKEVQVVTGVKHFIGPKGSGRYVIIHPNERSSHFDNKHPDELITETRQVTVKVPCATPPAAAVAQTTTAATQAETVVPPTQTVTVTTQAAGSVAGAESSATQTPAETTPQGGVLGAQATIAPKKPASGGVLGATGRIASSRLPFTGVELWIFALVAAALIGAGLTLRRAGRGTL